MGIVHLYKKGEYMNKQVALIVSAQITSLKLNQPHYEIIHATSAEKAIEYMQSIDCTLLLIEDTLPMQQQSMLKKICSLQQPQAKVIRITNSTHIASILQEVYEQQKKKDVTINIIDNAFQSVSLQISEQ